MPVAKTSTSWWSSRLGQRMNVARWGHAGQPVLLFPTAGGDFEECERFLMMKVLDPLLSAGRVRIYSCDSVAGRVWIDGESSGARRASVQTAFDGFVAHELVPAIRTDCHDPKVEPFTAGASIGAYNALAALCRHPDLFAKAICMSGTYDLTRWMNGEHTLDFHYSSPQHFLPMLGDGPQLAALRKRFVLLATGSGDYEAPWESWKTASILGAKGIPNRVDDWGKDWRHDWVTWRAMLPKYLDELTPAAVPAAV
jgi:esterase/lipase superfamily enzyme